MSSPHNTSIVSFRVLSHDTPTKMNLRGVLHVPSPQYEQRFELAKKQFRCYANSPILQRLNPDGSPYEYDFVSDDRRPK